MKKNNFKTLGETTYEQKKEIWANRMSGSQVKRVFKDTMNLFQEKMGDKEPIDLSKTKVAERLEMGNIMEPVIIERYKELHGVDVKIDKDTFESTDNPWFTANIDGYVGKDINNVEEIIEIKNTTVDSNNTLVDRYYFQVAYYMWFFNAKRAKLVVLKNGHHLEIIEIERDMEFEASMIAKLEEFRDDLDMGIPPTTQTKEQIEAEGRNVVSNGADSVVSEDVKDLFSKLKDVRSKKDYWTGVENEVKAALEKELADFGKVEYSDGAYKYQKIVSNRTGTVDNSKMIAALSKEYGFNAKATQDKYRKPGTKSVSFKVTEEEK